MNGLKKKSGNNSDLYKISRNPGTFRNYSSLIVDFEDVNAGSDDFLKKSIDHKGEITSSEAYLQSFNFNLQLDALAKTDNNLFSTEGVFWMISNVNDGAF